MIPAIALSLMLATAAGPARASVQWSQREPAAAGHEADEIGGHAGVESFVLGQRRQCDIFSLLMDSPSRRSFLDFTTPYLEIPGVIATSVNVPFVAGLDRVTGKRLGHMRGFAGIELLRQRHPGIHLVEVGSYEEGLRKVQNNELYGFIGNMMSIGRVLQENKISDVKIAGRIGHDERGHAQRPADAAGSLPEARRFDPAGRAAGDHEPLDRCPVRAAIRLPPVLAARRCGRSGRRDRAVLGDEAPPAESGTARGQ